MTKWDRALIRLRQFRQTVRYRLLVLTSAPILITIVALVIISLYWSVHYTWQNTLQSVSERLRVARSSVTFLLSEQDLKLNTLASSYQLNELLNKTTDTEEINRWLAQPRNRGEFDFIRYYPKTQAIVQGQTAQLGTYFSVLDAGTLADMNVALLQQAQIEIVDEHTIETRALVTRTLVPIYRHENQLIGYLDAGVLLNHKSQLVDNIRDLIYPSHYDSTRPNGTVTFFLDNIRVSTNISLASENGYDTRAVGTKVSPEVYEHVVLKGQEWVNLTRVIDRWFITAYQPLYDYNDAIIGMLYTGYPMWPVLKLYLTHIIEIGIFAILLLGISGIAVYRSARSLFRPIEQISRVVNAVQTGKASRIGSLGLNSDNELSQLALQFDRMLDILNSQQKEIIEFAKSLERQVDQRTISLNEKNLLLEQQLRLLEQTRNKLIAQEKLAALGELTAGIAHEINNPIAVILGNADLIKLSLPSQNNDFDDELRSIRKQVDRIRDIIRSLLQYSRKSETQSSRSFPQSINPIIEESVTLVRTGENKRNITFTFSLNAKHDVSVNRHQLLQVLVNLQVNAIQAMQGIGEITIQSFNWIEDDHDNGVAIAITDQGQGISQENINHIFDPFFTTKSEGTGLGLSVSKNLIDQMGGEIQVTSTSEQTTFTIFIPTNSN
ncbi:sensor histidine kinase [Vibrio sp. RC27]